MKIPSAGLSSAKFIAPLFASRLARAGLEDAVRWLEALQGIGTGAEFSGRDLKAIFGSLHGAQLVLFDVGAHTGQFLREALKRTAPDSVIHAFEPANASFHILSQAFADEPRARLNRIALARDSGSGVLFYDVPGSQLASLTPRPRFGHAKSESVRLQTLDEYCREKEVSQIDLLKLDVEGHEWEVLQGSLDLLSRHAIRQILFEFGGCHIDTRVFFRDFYEFLTERKMSIARLLPGGTFLPVDEYDESLERFRTTNYLATFGLRK